MRQGLTLIELLVVLGVLATLSSGMVALIDPLDKVRQATDAKVLNDLSQVATALQSYAAQRGVYPASATWTTDLTGSGELVVIPTPPTPQGNTAMTYNASGYVYGVNASFDVVSMAGKVISKRFKNNCGGLTPVAWWFWSSANGRGCGMCSTNAAPPGTGTACAW